jgi:hypothetical protein
MFYFMGKSTSILRRIEEDTTDVDLYALFDSPSTRRVFNLVIEADVLVRSTSTSNAALYASQDFPEGSALRIINKGCIHGMGGVPSGEPYEVEDFMYNFVLEGAFGGTAIKLPCSTFVDNFFGYIFGGGGSGTGCVVVVCRGVGPPQFAWSAAVAGNGAGTSIDVTDSWFSTLPSTCSLEVYQGEISSFGVSGSPGQGGSFTMDGNEFSSGAGGAYGENGASLVINGYAEASFPGGAAGAAVDPNGFQLTFTSGLTATRVKGSYT